MIYKAFIKIGPNKDKQIRVREDHKFVAEIGRTVKWYVDIDDETKKYFPHEIGIIPQTPWELFGIECGDGWKPLLKPIFHYIDKWNEEHPDADYPMMPDQINEKWGELCVYMNFSTKELDELIKTAEEEANKTCEFCGSKEHVGMTLSGWMSTTCHDCVKKMCNKNGRPIMWKDYAADKRMWVNPGDKEDEEATEQLP